MVLGAITGCADNKTTNPPKETSAPIITAISPKEAAGLIKDNLNNPDFLIIDVRTPAEFAEDHIANAVNIDYYSESFKDKLNNLDKDKTYLIYCRSGNRSANTRKIMGEMGFTKVYDISGGIANWKSEGLPVTK